MTARPTATPLTTPCGWCNNACTLPFVGVLVQWATETCVIAIHSSAARARCISSPSSCLRRTFAGLRAVSGCESKSDSIAIMHIWRMLYASRGSSLEWNSINARARVSRCFLPPSDCLLSIKEGVNICVVTTAFAGPTEWSNKDALVTHRRICSGKYWHYWALMYSPKAAENESDSTPRENRSAVSFSCDGIYPKRCCCHATPRWQSDGQQCGGLFLFEYIEFDWKMLPLLA